MAVGFGTITFDVVAPDALLPSDVPDERGHRWYTATIMVASNADMAALVNYATTITVVPSMGIRGGGTVIVEAGSGSRTLTFPEPVAGERVWSAILTTIEPTANMLHADSWMADCTWLLIEETV